VTVDLRRAEPVDAEAVAGVLITSRRDAYPAIPASVHPDGETRTWVREHLLPDCEVWVATVDGTVVAVLALHDDWVEQLYVLSEWSGRGVGGRLLDHAKERSPGGLQLWTFVSNEPARSFYERRGFTVVEQTDGSGNEEHQPDVRMTWRP
jgi:GNAT superfamily N-acetyltransferase